MLVYFKALAEAASRCCRAAMSLRERSGYYHGKRNDTIIEPEKIKKNEEKINQYCYAHRDTTVMDAVKNVLGFDK